MAKESRSKHSETPVASEELRVRSEDASLSYSTLARIQGAQRLSDLVYRTAIENAFGVPYRLNLLTREYDFVGDGIELLLGVPPKSLNHDVFVGMTRQVQPLDPKMPQDPHVCIDLFKDGSLQRYRADVRIVTPNGEEKWLTDSSLPITDSSGTVIAALGILQDITDRKRAEEELFRSNALYQALVDASEDYIFVLDSGYRFVYVSKASERRFGASGDTKSKIGKTPHEIIPDPENLAVYLGNLRKVFETGKPSRYEDSGSFQGRLVHAETLLSPIFGREGNVEFIVGVSRDITERRVAEEAIRHSEEVYRSAIALAEGVPYQRDASMNEIVFVGEGITRLTGYVPEEFNATVLTNCTQENILRGELAGFDFEEACIRTRAGLTNKWQCDIRILTRDGKTKWLADNAIQMKDHEGKVTGSLGILYDITERKENEERLRRQEEDERHFSQQLITLTEITNELSKAESMDDMCRRAIELGCSRLGFERLGLWFHENDGKMLQGSYGVDGQGNILDERHIRKEVVCNSFLWKLIQDKRSHILPAETQFPDREGQGTGENIFAIAPLWDGTSVVGSLMADNYLRRTPVTDRMGDILTLYATALGNLWAIKRAEEEVARHNKRLSILAELAQLTSGNLPPSVLCDELVGVTKRVMPCDLFFVSNYLGTGSQTEYLRCYELVDGVFKEVSSCGIPESFESSARLAMETQKPVLVHRMGESQAPDGELETMVDNLVPASLIIVPMMVGDKATGLISVQSNRIEAYTQWHVDMLVSLAQQFGPALEASILSQKIVEREEAERRFGKRLATLVEITNSLAVSNSIDELCLHAVELGRSRIDFDRLSIALIDVRKEKIHCTYGTDEEGRTRDERNVEHSIDAEDFLVLLFRENAPLIYEKSVGLYDYSANCVGIGDHAIVVISDGKEPLGCISIDNLLTSRPITLQETELLRLYASVIGTLISRKRAEEEQRKLESQIQHTQKLESLGILAGGIAHDFNNLLMGILGNAGMALMEMSEDSPARYSVEQIEKASQRAAELTKQMLAYSGKGKFVVDMLNLSALVEEMSHLLDVSISKKAVLRCDLVHDLPLVEGDPTQIRQIIMNLLTNASDAISDQPGVISVRTGVRKCDQDYLSGTYVNDALPEGDYVYLEVSDTGCGMEKSTEERIFDPFFTTKFQGRGLGLAAVLGIVRGHHGTIKVDSVKNQGTTFTVLLPPASVSKVQKRKTQEAQSLSSISWRGQGLVMVVDDEETVLSLARRTLERFGFTVLIARDGIEAVETFKTNPSDIRLVLLDLTMPHMDGDEAYREMRKIRSDVCILLSSGFDEQEAVQRFSRQGLAGFIQKPYRPQMLIDKVREVLDE